MAVPVRDNLLTGRLDDALLETLKRVAAVLKRTELPFALAGGFAVYALGGASSDHDVDFLLREEDLPAVREALEEAGFVTEQPPEDWLVKVYDGDRPVDLIHRPVERPVTDATLADSTVVMVTSMHLPVMSATALMIYKLLTFSQHHCDFTRALPMARSLREQIDWHRVRRETSHSPFAEAFLVLLDRLGIVPMVRDLAEVQ
ncbi:MAG TPA: nucleotidyltransferase [Natronosporangium sp.]|jgi:hypothetical protein|nr:nucleotidyltransferase [Natronosporangium sp.]